MLTIHMDESPAAKLLHHKDLTMKTIDTIRFESPILFPRRPEYLTTLGRFAEVAPAGPYVGRNELHREPMKGLARSVAEALQT